MSSSIFSTTSNSFLESAEQQLVVGLVMVGLVGWGGTTKVAAIVYLSNVQCNGRAHKSAAWNFPEAPSALY